MEEIRRGKHSWKSFASDVPVWRQQTNIRERWWKLELHFWTKVTGWKAVLPRFSQGSRQHPKLPQNAPLTKRQYGVCVWFSISTWIGFLPFKVPNFPNCIQIYTSIWDLNFVLICLTLQFLKFSSTLSTQQELAPSISKTSWPYFNQKIFSLPNSNWFFRAVITDNRCWNISTFYFFFPQDFKMGFKKISYRFLALIRFFLTLLLFFSQCMIKKITSPAVYFPSVEDDIKFQMCL